MANIKNIIGNKYGRLTVLELIDRNDNGKKLLVKGRNLYPNLLQHIQGDISKKESY